MSREIRQIALSDNPESYDLLGGTPNVERIFSLSCGFGGKPPLPVFTRRVSEVIRRGSYWLKHVRYPNLALEMILEGEMEFRTEERHQIAGPGTLYLIPPGTTVRFTGLRGREVRKLGAILAGENLKGILLTLKLANSRMIPLADPAVIAEKLRGLKAAVTASKEENSERSYHFLLELSGLLGENDPAQTPLGRAMSLMESKFQEDLQIPEIAVRAGVSERTLRRLFQTELHCSPLDCLNAARLRFAAGKLRHTSLRIKEIAQMSGFLSSAGFCTAFRKKYRMSPGAFRQQGKDGN